MITCPNKNLQEWKELESTVPDMAYTIWDLNNGNGIDRSPNGEPSMLFQSLLNYYNGDREAAIKAKAKFYNSAFRNKYNGWSDAELDVNGEPLFDTYGRFVVEDSTQ